VWKRVYECIGGHGFVASKGEDEEDRVKIIAVHHRHGNGEKDDFTDGYGRGNRDDIKVVQWIVKSVATIAQTMKIHNYKVGGGVFALVFYSKPVYARRSHDSWFRYRCW
jgi:hypothetical protein